MIVIRCFGVSFFARRDREDQIPVARALLPPSQRGGPAVAGYDNRIGSCTTDHYGSDCPQSPTWLNCSLVVAMDRAQPLGPILATGDHRDHPDLRPGKRVRDVLGCAQLAGSGALPAGAARAEAEASECRLPAWRRGADVQLEDRELRWEGNHAHGRLVGRNRAPAIKEKSR
jgi:hypothetical protein